MRFDPNRCVHCGGPPRVFTSEMNLGPNGRLRSRYQDFFFCSDQCFTKELNRHLPPEYALGKGNTFEDDPEVKSLVKDWEDTRKRRYPPDRLLSNEELAEMARFDEREKAKLNRRLDELEKAGYIATDKAVGEIYETWNAHHDQKGRLDTAEREAEEQKLREEQQAFEQLIAPRPIPDHLRYEHTHILGPSGSGKTTLLQHLILQHPNDAYLILDPKGTDLFEPLAKIPELADRLILIDPFDKPALPLLGFRNSKEAVSNSAYVFSTTRQKLTGQQETCFSFCVSLLFHVPNPTLFTLLDLLDDQEKRRDPRFIEAARHTDDFTQRFFGRDYFTQTFQSTKEQIKARVYAVARDPYLRVMFDAPTKTFDMLSALQQGKIILVNTQMNALGDQHQTLGRFLISQFFDAVTARSNIPKAQWNPAFLIVDEAQEFIDSEKMPRMLRLMRSFNAGAVLAHHNMYNDVFDDSIRAAISTNTGIKFCSDPRGMDINYMARDMRCESDFLTKYARKTKTEARFACLFSELDHPFLYSVPLGHIQSRMKASNEAYDNLREKNRRALAAVERPHTRPVQVDPLPESNAPRAQPATFTMPSGAAAVAPAEPSPEAGLPENKTQTQGPGPSSGVRDTGGTW